MERGIDKFLVDNEEFRLWLTCANGLDIRSMAQLESWCEREGYEKGTGWGMASERWEKHWIREAKLATGALPSET